ncbi:hypothetical protein SASPL_116032 [Salvia splendens]|uniref:DUF6817 domain-containing protein n=1 Tax=Salvia splendens TaxID=180675 RepID=A0A8X9A2Q1_SALSN|nr:uncharacterized protein LOC121802771 [Salvia splendens]KAG6425591.1 hypothetical protein SASPL_116032 [Salvia splendens]
MAPPSSTSIQPSDNHKPRSAADHRTLESLLHSARPFLRGELHAVDENLPRLVSVLQAAGAGECWHKHNSFFDHLLGVYRTLKLWNAPQAVCLCALFHSAYSNSYVNLAIFPPSPTGRDTVRGHVGAAAERLIHLFCVVPRHSVTHGLLLSRYSDSELVEDLRLSAISIEKLRGGGEVGEDEIWRNKIRSIIPPEGVSVKHIKTGEDIQLSRRLVATFLLMTIADISESLFGFHDGLFDNRDGRFDCPGNNVLTSLWPGIAKPGLCMNTFSRMAAIYSLLVREEEIYLKSLKNPAEGRDGDLELVVPPVFDNCSKVLDPQEQIVARDLYWKAVCDVAEIGVDKAEEMLVESVARNPFAGEVHVVLAQIYLGKGEFAAAAAEAEKGLRLLLEWGSPRDKRMTWHAWVSWVRVLLMKAKEKSWPETAWGLQNLGLVA